jgi:hypothetical protein
MYAGVHGKADTTPTDGTPQLNWQIKKGCGFFPLALLNTHDILNRATAVSGRKLLTSARD